MGVQQKVTYPQGNVPPWPVVSELLARQGFPVQVRMIDGELSFPDELPPASWRELRLSTPQGMVTLRREPDGLTLVTWGNADLALQQAWNALTWAWAEAGGGQVVTEAGTVSAAEFCKTAAFPASLRL